MVQCSELLGFCSKPLKNERSLLKVLQRNTASITDSITLSISINALTGLAETGNLGADFSLLKACRNSQMSKASVTLHAAPISALWRGICLAKETMDCVCFAPRAWLTKPAQRAAHLPCTLSTVQLRLAEGQSSTEGVQPAQCLCLPSAAHKAQAAATEVALGFEGVSSDGCFFKLLQKENIKLLT